MFFSNTVSALLWGLISCPCLISPLGKEALKSETNQTFAVITAIVSLGQSSPNSKQLCSESTNINKTHENIAMLEL